MCVCLRFCSLRSCCDHSNCCRIRQGGATPHSRFLHAAFELHGKVVVHGGWGFLEQGDQAVSSIRVLCCCELTKQSRVYVEQEVDQWEDESLYFSDCRVFDPRTNEWQDNESLQRIFGQKFAHKILRFNNIMLCILGHNGTVPISDVNVARLKSLTCDHIIPPPA